jgi:cytochrome c oxidase assembly protein subunit 15
MSLPRISPQAYRRVTLLALVALAFIVVTGGAVRLTGSGLGCPDWPTCAAKKIVDPTEYHRAIESINRTITGLVSFAVIAAVLASRLRSPRRRDLTLLSFGLVGGVLGQIVLGGLTVIFDLAPPFVMGHFLLSMLLLWCAVVLHHRAGLPDDVAAAGVRPVVDRDSARLCRLLVVACAVVVFLGTIVTSSGPHGGDIRAERLPFALHQVTRLHGIAVVLFLALALYTAWSLTRSAPAGRVVLRRVEVLLLVIVAQGAVGYAQYFTRLPPLLVGIHIAGAAAVWIASLRVALVAVGPTVAVETVPERVAVPT